jgi:hypothetical protein
MGVAKEKYRSTAKARKGPLPKKLSRNPIIHKMNGGRLASSTKAEPLKPGIRDGMYHHEIWWDLRRRRTRYFDEFPSIGTKVVSCFMTENGSNKGEFFRGTVLTVKFKTTEGEIKVVFDDGEREVFTLAEFNSLACPVDELWDSPDDAVLDADRLRFWIENHQNSERMAASCRFRQAVLAAKMHELKEVLRLSVCRLAVLELCCGGKSFAKYIRSIYPDALVITVDVLSKFGPTHCGDIRSWRYEDYYPPGLFHIVWNSPPCTEYSPAKTTGAPRDLKGADSIVMACLDITAKAIRRKKDGTIAGIYFLENPHTMLHKRTCMRFLRFNLTVCCYCRYGTKYKKETSIYSNIADLQLKRCTRTHPCECVVNGCHPQQAQNGANAKGVPGTQKEVAQRVPKRLLRTLLESAKQHFSPQEMTRLYL